MRRENNDKALFLHEKKRKTYKNTGLPRRLSQLISSDLKEKKKRNNHSYELSQSRSSSNE